MPQREERMGAKMVYKLILRAIKSVNEFGDLNIPLYRWLSWFQEWIPNKFILITKTTL